MKSELSLLEKRRAARQDCSETDSLTDWERVRKMRDEDIVIDDEHPEATEEDFKVGVVRHNMKIVRTIK